MKKQFLVLVAIAFAGWAYLSMQRGTPTFEDKSTGQSSSTRSVLRGQDAVDSGQGKAHKLPMPKFAASQSDRSEARVDAKSSTTVMSVVQSPAKYVEAARAGDARSALLLVTAVDGCFPIAQSERIDRVEPARTPPAAAWPECSALDPALAVNRLELLMPAIRSGSPEAKLAYAVRARQLFLNDPNAGEFQLHYTLDQVGRTAKQYATDAALAGIGDAYAFLAGIYFQGDFGSRDPVVAFAYAIALDRVQPGGIGAYLSERYSTGLTPQQRSRAAELSKKLPQGCCV